MKDQLEEFKDTWKEVGAKIDGNKTLSDDDIMVLAKKSNRSMKRIIYAEGIGGVITLGVIIYILVNFGALETWPNILAGIGLLVTLALAIILGLQIITTGSRIDLINDSYAETEQNFMKFKMVLGRLKKASIIIYILTPFLIAPVYSKILLGKDLFLDLNEFKEVIIASVLILPIVWYLIVRFYKSNVSNVKKSMEQMNGGEDQK